ncbi:carbohydrate-binding module family 18 [Niveomyces insectorum RCEF 264]|uniref:Carbohydrate-binding module family 18 n=1 Tax=Niveomyces insectorum RCEF 264 TaxID=1081102 RepID=A0A167Y086_9HYPO|nr:carbohydrate-binding module family 18 [Niveomyces insectorum RCEF 264]
MRAFASWAVGLLMAGAATAVAAADAGGLPDKAAILKAVAAQPGIVEFDHGDHHYVVLPRQESQHRAKNASSSNAVSPRSVLDRLLNKRQYCDVGYGYCSSFGRCCPSYDDCCPYGYCIDPDDACCPNGPCAAGQSCCGDNHCYPVGGACCRDESSCEPGNHCYKVRGYTRDICCTDDTCSAFITGGVTVTRTTSVPFRTQPPATFTNTAVNSNDYYFTITWTYYYYFWYEVDVTRSVVTSTLTTDSTRVTVTATDPDAATESFSELSSTFTPSTPAAATSLETLAGSTTTASPATFGGGGGGGGPLAGTTSEPTTTRTSANGGGAGATGGGVSSPNGAASLRLAGDGLLGLWLALGAVTGVLMVVL